MPEDPPHLEFLFNCALSAPAPTAPGCIVVLGLVRETYLRYCRVGDETWSQVDVTFEVDSEVFNGAVAFHGGKIYAATNASYSVVVDATGPAPAAPLVERTDIKILPPFVGIEEDEEDCDEYDETTPPPDTKAYWSVPSNGRFKFELPRQGSSKGDGQEKSISRPDPTLSSDECPPPQWTGVNLDTDRGHQGMAVAHDPAQPRGGNGGSFHVFDPVTKNRYTLSARVPGVTVPDDSASLMLHGSKDGWLLVSRGQYSFFLMNPFKRGDDAMVVLPPAHELFFKGISCSTPGSHDFTVMIIEGFSFSDHDTVAVRTWRPGQASWEQHGDFECEVGFLLATHNPLFFDGEFYCLARDGKLGVSNPRTMAWRVLAEWKGEVIIVWRYTYVEEPIDIFQLDRERMAWSKMEVLEGGAVFWDRKQATLRSALSLAHNGVRECVF
ncbi:hypothetical protein C2845_PM12G16430 [Panicum miliaceum]|uniref:KIB1-4 beta-propeller domain-containing protein n=1 Tax=Panicum miliaceum TaxID=4540 RepID=A0A3L6QH57_PANMI|nr:hypothetical protein C2845_PM12G16430 [Panicum miliaceum]